VERIQGQLRTHLERLNRLGKTLEGLTAQLQSVEESNKSTLVSLESNLQALSERVSLALNDFRARLDDLSAKLDRLGGQEVF
jgi:predicted  nucleic acid-binding Zn-ribbon protein